MVYSLLLNTVDFIWWQLFVKLFGETPTNYNIRNCVESQTRMPNFWMYLKVIRYFTVEWDYVVLH
jgi:hypothetical protein